MTVTEEKYGEVYEEFGPPKKKTRAKETSKTDESVIEEIRCQDGYSYNPVEKCVIEDWDNKLIVIADADADPFCLDITAANSPVYYAMHGMDEWDFDVFSESFEDFWEFLGLS